MHLFKKSILLFFLFVVVISACNQKSEEEKKSNTKLIKGLYSFGPEINWVADSAKTLELAYSNFNFEKPYEPVYIEVECHFIKSDSLIVSADFDSTMVVTKLLKITKEIPDGPCR
jgi:hypothetical protein